MYPCELTAPDTARRMRATEVEVVAAHMPSGTGKPEQRGSDTGATCAVCAVAVVRVPCGQLRLACLSLAHHDVCKSCCARPRERVYLLLLNSAMGIWGNETYEGQSTVITALKPGTQVPWAPTLECQHAWDAQQVQREGRLQHGGQPSARAGWRARARGCTDT